MVLNFAKYDDTTYFPERYFLYLIFFILIYFNFFCSSKKYIYISSFFIASLSVLSIFWYFDVFLFINASFFLYLIFLYLVKDRNKIKQIIFSLLFFTLLFFLFFPNNELIDFAKNQYFIIFEINKFTSIDYPSQQI